jgi:hypothetical protein
MIFQIFKIYVFIFFYLFISNSPVLGGFMQENNSNKLSVESNNLKLRRIVLLGASVGEAWDLPSLPQRIDNENYAFEYMMCPQFDKSDFLKDIIAREENKPDAVFIKECAAYFPGDLENYKSLIKEWIEECLKADITPIPATVAPVTRLHSFKKIAIDVLRGRKPFRQGNPFKYLRNKSILEFNDWLREYCKNMGLSVLDLEAALRYSEDNRFLKENLSRIDGLHLNRKAYGILDQIVIPVLEEATRKS